MKFYYFYPREKNDNNCVLRIFMKNNFALPHFYLPTHLVRTLIYFYRSLSLFFCNNNNNKITIVIHTDRSPSMTVHGMCSRSSRHVTKSVTVNLAASVIVVVVHLYMKLGPACAWKNNVKCAMYYTWFR